MDDFKYVIMDALKQINGKWDTIIIKLLSNKDLRYNEILKNINNITPKSLAESLKKLNQHNIIGRNVVSTQPFTVIYSLTEKGTELIKHLNGLEEWENTCEKKGKGYN